MNTQGIGLGLVISENIVKAFSGIIGVKSKWGRGTKFAFCMAIGKDPDYVEQIDAQGSLEPAPQHMVNIFNNSSSQSNKSNNQENQIVKFED